MRCEEVDDGAVEQLLDRHSGSWLEADLVLPPGRHPSHVARQHAVLGDRDAVALQAGRLLEALLPRTQIRAWRNERDGKTGIGAWVHAPCDSTMTVNDSDSSVIANSALLEPTAGTLGQKDSASSNDTVKSEQGARPMNYRYRVLRVPPPLRAR